MKTILTVLILCSLPLLAAPGDTSEAPVLPVSIQVEKRTPIALENVMALRTYASTNNYYFGVNLQEGMRVLYSASYGIGGEAGQASGRVVKDQGRFWFRQDDNTTMQLLLPPGLPLNSSAGHSLWDLGAYMQLINRVAFSDPNESSKTATDVYASKPDAAIVDFKGGTAGQSVTYADALEVAFTRTVENRSLSNWKVYYGKGIGPVALEFREDMSPTGTFKFYLGK